ncbi:MAG: hypothetical protein RBR97_07125 [Bacteroidales bacterium]|nr:hypothetical protein [Bacteroidales bacterium]
MTNNGRFTIYKEGCQAFKQWQKKYKNPLDLDNILHSENIRLKDNDSGKIFYVNIKAMEENTRHGRIAFIGITIRSGNLYDLATREEEAAIRSLLDEKLKTIAEKHNCIY